jgi:hypothetical protein
LIAPQPIRELTPVKLPRESWGERVFTQLSTGLDATMVRAMRIVVERALISDPKDLAALRATAEAVMSPELQADPSSFFDFLEEQQVPDSVSDRFVRKLPGGSVQRVGIHADYTPYGFEDESSPSGQPIRLERWQHEDDHPRATVLTLHGFTMGYPRIDAFALFANDWYSRGLDVALLTLPYHGARKPADSLFSGDRFAVPHVSRMGEAMRQAIYEIRLVTRWLRSETGRPVGVLGLSLGGYLTSLLAGLCDELDFVIPIVPPVCIGDLAWRFIDETRHTRDGTQLAFSKDELRSAYRIHSPLTYPLAIPRERALIIAGRGDRIVPPEHPHALWEHWGRPDIHWFSGSHLAPFGRRRVVDRIVAHFERLHIL